MLRVLGLWLRVLPLLVRPLTVLRLLVLCLLELRGPGLWPLWWLVPQVLELVVLWALGLRLLAPLLLVHHVLDLRPRVLRLLARQPRILQAMKLWPQVLGLVVLHVLGLRLRVLPLRVRPLTVLRLLVLWLLELRGPGLWPLW